MKIDEAYEDLSARSTETAYLGSAVGLLHWDQRTNIPPLGHPYRIDQLGLFARILHQRMSDPKIGELLSEVEESDLVKDPVSVPAVNIREWRRSYDRITKIPEELAVELAKAASEGQSVWEKARPQNDWRRFEPCLKRIVKLKRQEAEALGYENERYDALLDAYEPDATADELEPVLRKLADSLVKLLGRIQASPKVGHEDLSNPYFPVPEQEAFAREVAGLLGYEFDGGRLDLSAHPFTVGIGPGDVRITTRYSEDSFKEAFFAVIHESGHAMYHQGLPVEFWGNPMCRPASLGINESQSRMWENMVARSPAFWRHFYPKAQERFSRLRTLPVEDFLLSINKVTPSLVRVEADEVTYNMHVLLRFELEVALTRGDLEVADLPDAWNAKTREYLGLTPPDYAQGIMQDVHWSSGHIGYFPTYTLGNLYAAQFFAAAEKALGSLDEQFAAGEFVPLLQWLRENIHSEGKRYRPSDLVRHVTGEDLTSKYLIDYLTRKYEALYGI